MKHQSPFGPLTLLVSLLLWGCGPSQPPSTPNFKSATATSTTAQLSWEAVSGATQYALQRGEGSIPTSWSSVALPNPTDTSVTDSGLAPETTYTYRLKAMNGAGSSFYRNQTLTTAAILPQPSGFTATVTDSTTVTLSWAEVAGATAYRLLRGEGTNPSSYSALPLPYATTSYVDQGLTADATYTYRLQAITPTAETAYAERTVSVKIAPGVPGAVSNLVAVANPSTNVELNWNAVAGAASYTIERGNGSIPSSFSVLVNAVNNYYTDTTAASGLIYTYRVKANNASGSGDYSNLQTVTIPGGSGGAVGAISNLNAVATNSVTVNLSWGAASNASSYKVERGDGTTPSSWLTLGNPTSTAYTDTTARPLALHTYRVTPTNASGSGTAASKSITLRAPTLEVIATGMDTPWSINFAPDGRLLFTPRNQTNLQIRSINPSSYTGTPITTYTSYPASGIAVRLEAESGILGMDLDPNFATNKYVYICYSYSQGSTDYNRVSRFTLGSNSLGSELKMIDNIPGNNTHNGCRVLVVGNYLFASMGDNGFPNDAQVQNGGRGRLFRIRLDGTVPTDNPFPTASNTLGKLTWHYGLRNSQGLALQPGTTTVWSTEHGANTRDEINLFSTTSGGKNYGWPVCAGTQAFNVPVTSVLDGATYQCSTSASATLTQSSYQPAKLEYEGGDKVSIAPSDLVFYPATATAFTAWRNNLFFVTLKTGRLYRLAVDGNNVSNGSGEIIFNPINIGSDQQRLRDITVGPDGLIYISTDSGAILRLKP